MIIDIVLVPRPLWYLPSNFMYFDSLEICNQVSENEEQSRKITRRHFGSKTFILNHKIWQHLPSRDLYKPHEGSELGVLLSYYEPGGQGACPAAEGSLPFEWRPLDAQWGHISYSKTHCSSCVCVCVCVREVERPLCPAGESHTK